MPDAPRPEDEHPGASPEETQQEIAERERARDEFAASPTAPGWLRPLLAYQRGMDRVTEAVGSISKYLVVAVVAIGFGNALLRYIGRFTRTQLTSNRYIELQWYLYAALFLLAFAYILKNGINVRVDFWFAEQSARTKAWIDFVGHLIGLLPFAILALWVVWDPVLKSWGRSPSGFSTWRVWEIWERSPDPGGLPRAPIKSMLVIGFGMLLLQGLAEMVKLLAELTGHGRFVRRASEEGPLRVE